MRPPSYMQSVVERNVVMRRIPVYVLLQEPSLKLERISAVTGKFRGFLQSLHISVKDNSGAGRDHSVTKALQITADMRSPKETAGPLKTCIDQ
jgi:hypothetical protein